jgi:hypothetical protein
MLDERVFVVETSNDLLAFLIFLVCLRTSLSFPLSSHDDLLLTSRSKTPHQKTHRYPESLDGRDVEHSDILIEVGP